MKAFMDKDFQLNTPTAQKLYFDYAAKMPIIDYHCHISPKEIAENKTYESITEVWLGGDHYKWRVMRACGVDERLITGDATPYEKFEAWANTLPKCVGNPLYHWAHMELKTYFGFDEPLSGKNAKKCFDICNKRLVEEKLSVRDIIKMSNVKLICTTDDPIDSLEWHEKIKNDPTCEVKVIPAWRPDKAVNIDKGGFVEYIQKLGEVSGVKIDSFEALKKALSLRLDHFCAYGCKASDHGLDAVVFAPCTDEEADAILKKALSGGAVSEVEARQYMTALLLFFGREYARRGIVMQLHYGAIRNNNTPMFKALGPDTGFDSIAKPDCAMALSRFLDTLNCDNLLPKTIVYAMNAYDNEVISTTINCFNRGGEPAKMQLGSAWWFNDTKTGMKKQLTDLANTSVLANFVGMLTDSRSFLSYTRHDYFRRILCDLIGTWVEEGEYPCDMEFLGKMVQDISYNNTVNYFGFDVN